VCEGDFASRFAKVALGSPDKKFMKSASQDGALGGENTVDLNIEGHGHRPARSTRFADEVIEGRGFNVASRILISSTD